MDHADVLDEVAGASEMTFECSDGYSCAGCSSGKTPARKIGIGLKVARPERFELPTAWLVARCFQQSRRNFNNLAGGPLQDLPDSAQQFRTTVHETPTS